MGGILLPQHFQNGCVAGSLGQFHHLLSLGIDLQLALVIQDDPLHQILLGIVVLRRGSRNGGCKVSDVQQAGFLGNQLLGGSEAAAVAECLADIGFYHMAVILGAVEPGAIPVIGDCIEQHTQFILVGLQLCHSQGAETALDNAHEPCGEVGRNRSTLLVIHLDLLGFHG